MTQALAKTNRILLEEVNEVITGELAVLRATNRILTARLDSALRDNAILMRMVGRMTLDRSKLNAADERLEPKFGNTRNCKCQK